MHLSRSASSIFSIACMFILSLAPAFSQTPTTTQLALSSPETTAGVAVTLTASVASGSIPLTSGQIVFCDVSHVSACLPGSANLLGLVQLTSSGKASLKIRTGAGSHALVAHFVGTVSASQSSSGKETLTVKAPVGAAVTQTLVYATQAEPNGYPVQGVYDVLAQVTAPPGNSAFTGKVNIQVASPATTTVLGSAAVTSSSSNAVQFGAPQTLPGVGGNAAVADFNEDGIPDLAVGSTPVTGSTAVIYALAGNGDGSFATPATSNAVPGAGCSGSFLVQCAVATADFNGDGHADLVTVQPTAGTAGGDTLQFAYGKGDGTFTAGPTIQLTLAANNNPQSPNTTPQILVGDFNGDGLPDLLVNAVAGSSVTVNLAVLLQKADHSFAVSYPTTFGQQALLPPAIIAVGDLNNDGKSDFAGAAAAHSALVFLSNGDGTFIASSVGNLDQINYSPNIVFLADFTGDGVPDIALLSSFGGDGALELNNGHGSFTEVGTPELFQGEETLSVVDMNGDGLADIASIYIDPGSGVGSAQGFALIGDGKGGFTEQDFTVPASLQLGEQEHQHFPVSALPSVDLNADGLQDLIFTETSGAACCAILLNQTGYQVATEALTNVQMPAGGSLSLTASYADQGGLAGSTSAPVMVDGTPVTTTLQLTVSLQTASEGQPLTFTATLSPYTADGFVTDGEPVTFQLDSGTGSATTIQETLFNGQATFPAYVLPVGTINVRASYNGDDTFTAANSNTVSAVITPAVPSLGALNGRYLFLVQGKLPAQIGPVSGIAAGGWFVADGLGHITSGLEDVNSATVSATASALQGSYSVGPDGSASLQVTNAQGQTQTLGAVLAGLDSRSIAQGLSLLELDSSGLVSSGTAAAQVYIQGGSSATLGGAYTLKLLGETACQGATCSGTGHGGGAVSLLGSLVINYPAQTGSGPAAENVAGSALILSPLQASFTQPDANGSFTLTLTSAGAPSDQPTHFEGYLVGPAKAYLVSTDPHESKILLSGTLEQQ